MFDIVIDMIIDFAELLPYIIPVILVMNICSSLLFGEK